MKKSIIVILTALFFSLNLNGQIQAIIGRVIAEDLEPLPGVDIQDSDTVLGKTDMDGQYKISLPQGTDRLLFTYLGMEPTEIKLREDCDTIEVVMMYAGSYDFMTLKKVDKLRKKEFDNLPNLHSEAVKNGIFEKNNICYERIFKADNPTKPVLDSIKKVYKFKKKQIKVTFNGLALGDTIRIPYYGTPRYNGTGKTTLNPYSFAFDGENFDCIIQGIITDKDKRKGEYNLVYRVIHYSDCHYDNMVLDGKELKNGELIEYKMRYTKTLKNN